MKKETKLFPLLQIAGGGVIDEMSVFVKPGSVAGAVPAVFLLIPLQSTTQMRASRDRGRQQIFGGFQKIQSQLLVEYIS